MPHLQRQGCFRGAGGSCSRREAHAASFTVPSTLQTTHPQPAATQTFSMFPTSHLMPTPELWENPPPLVLTSPGESPQSDPRYVRWALLKMKSQGNCIITNKITHKEINLLFSPPQGIHLFLENICGAGVTGSAHLPGLQQSFWGEY